MKKFTSGLLSRTKSADNPVLNPDSPEANAARAVRLFCESGSPNNAGEEVLHLPVIVEAAESSPQAAASAAYQIRKFLSKDNNGRPHVQYNSIMLVRILAENPGPTFTRNIDTKFVATVKALLKDGRDASVQQILRETLDSFEVQKGQDPGLQQILVMWRNMKGAGARLGGPPQHPRYSRTPPFDPRAPPVLPAVQQQQHPGSFGGAQLPSPSELATRVEESRNTSKILLQLLQSTPTEEIMGNDLIKEFAERCQSASRSMQQYINSDNPVPDDDTMQTLIETNEQLSLSLSRYQRAVLSARRALGASSATASPDPSVQQPYSPPTQNSAFAPPPQPPRSANQTSLTAGLSPVSPESESSTYSAPQHPPPNIANRPAERSAPSQKPLPRNPPPAPVIPHAEPAQDPFGDGTAERSTYESSEPDPGYGAHPFEPAHYGRPISMDNTETATAARPGFGGGAYHNGVTESYVGRQTSAADGLTMHGAGAADVSEIDGESREGRDAHLAGAGVSPLAARKPIAYRY